MAALVDPYPHGDAPQPVELRHLRAEDLAAVLADETVCWRRLLEWDFEPSAELVRRFVGMQALSGFGLVDDTRVVGYSYFVCEERKGLVGDLYVLPAYATVEAENRLLEAVLGALRRTPLVRRIESQLMMLRPAPGRPFPMSRDLHVYPREFMVADLAVTDALPAVRSDEVVYEPWSDRVQEGVAQLIALCYKGHVDSSINDQYRSLPGARKFLMNIVQYPGCGSFFQPAALVATRAGTTPVRGVSLTSMVAPDVGHVTQICVHPEQRGHRIGYELLRRSMVALKAAGCRKASLTVTSDNRGAIELYERMGFAKKRNFSACVWEW